MKNLPPFPTPEASEVIAESYSAIDQLLYSGDVPPELGKNVLVNLGNAHSITLVGTAFLVLAAALEKRRKTMVGLNDAAVLSYTSAGGAGSHCSQNRC
ncbi:hypothetical protein [Thermococcus sp. JCM 11816]|uniref:hypothetical protein n=1 Tax=Thermococcus sp. (strain JCM 11816 / KS-1) TaxID=1295125 RepID=UPI0006D016C2